MGTIEKGAKIAVNKCMKIQPEDTVLIIADDPTREIGMAIRTESLKVTDKVRFFNLDLPTYGGRPIKDIPDTLVEATSKATVTLFVAGAFEGELQTLRAPFLKLAMQKARHGHMVGINKEIMETGMCVDYDKVSKITNKLYEILSKGTELHVTSPAGTDFVATLDPTLRWKKDSGVIDTPCEWENLPSGEIFTAPKTLEGRLVCDGTVGEWIGIKYNGKLDYKESPISVQVENRPEGSYLKSVKCKHKDLLKDFKKYVGEVNYASRVGELGLGTNIFLKELVGNILQDEKFPTVHVAFGDPYHSKTGANWSCNHHIDLLMRECTVELDGKEIMKKGEYIKEITK
jgi:leucyl aminopeptidase (aminopeptidase T)